jgi:hypothetical protein
MPRPRLPGEHDEAGFAQALRALEGVHDDRIVIQQLRGGRARDAIRGNVIPRHVYRLECGHLATFHGTKLPTGTRRVYCPGDGCRRERDVVEWLTSE